jgi:cold-inducible RNA-binding protein
LPFHVNGYPIAIGFCHEDTGFQSQRRKDKVLMGTRLYIGNLSYHATEDDLRTFFEQAGSVTGCDVMFDRHTGRSKGFAFVEMASQEDADKVIETYNGKDFQGRPLTINVARPRAEGMLRNFGGVFDQRDVGAGGKRRSGKGSRRGLRNEKRRRKGIF